MIVPIIVLLVGGGLLLRSLYNNGRRIAHLALLTILVGAVIASFGNLLGLLIMVCGGIGYRRLQVAPTIPLAKRGAKAWSSIGLSAAVLPNLAGLGLLSTAASADTFNAPLLAAVSNVSQIPTASLAPAPAVDPSVLLAPSEASSLVPAVRQTNGRLTPTWWKLNQQFGSDTAYKRCVEKILPGRNKQQQFSWSRDVLKYAAAEVDQNARFVVVIGKHNLGSGAAAEAKARAIASDDTGLDLSTAGVVFTDYIINTQGFENGGCTPFHDDNPQIRVSLGQIVFNGDGSQSLDGSNGVFVDCQNPWTLPPAEITTTTTKKAPASTTTSSSTTSSTSTSTSSTSTTSSSTTSTTVRSTTTSSTSTSSTSSSTTSSTSTSTSSTSTSSTSTTSTTVGTTTTSKPLTDQNSCQQNGTGPNCPFLPVQQPPQNNSTSGSNTGSTPGAPAAPPPTIGPAPTVQPNTPAPANNSTGHNSGSGTGGNTPSGSDTNTSTGGTQTGSNNTSPPANTGQGGSNTGTTIADPFA